MHPRKSLSYPQWVKLGNIGGFTFVGKDTVAVGSGCHIIFFTVESKVENIYIANSKQRGDGVACIAGHRTAPLFAFAEKCLHPRILVFSYPALEGPVSVLKGGTMGSYISMAFSEMEYLVTLTGVPEFSIVVWCWRTGTQLACKETGIVSLSQKLSCSLSSPSIVSHIVKGKSLLLIWEINVCAKLCCLTSEEVQLPDDIIPVDVCFTNDGVLLFVDTQGDVYEVDLEENKAVRQTLKPTSENELLTEMDEEAEISLPTYCDTGYETCMTFCKAGALVFEPPSKLKLYRRFGDWSEIWHLNASSPLSQLVYLPEPDLVVGWTLKSEIVLIDCGKVPKVSVLKYYGTNFIDMDLIYPDGNTIVCMNTNDELQVWDKSNGHLMGVYNVRSASIESLRPTASFNCLKSNPHYPYVAVALGDGLLLLVSILHPTSPATLATFLLCEEEISLICFAPAGDVFVASTARTGQFFLIQGIPGQEMQIMAHLVLGTPVVDCVLVPDELPVLAVLLAKDAHSAIGNSVALYTVESDGLHLDIESHLDNNYTKLVNGTSKNICFGTPYCSRNIHKLEIKRKVGVLLKNVEITGHQLRSVLVSERVEYGLLSYGMDGIVIAQPSGSKHQFYVVLPHHRSDLGVMKAFQDPQGEFILSLGRDGSLVCSKLKRTAKYTPESTEPSSDMKEKFTEPTIGFFLEGENAGITWLQYKVKLSILQEEQQAAAEKAKIFEDFKKLQEKVVQMLDANEKAAPEERLPISAFHLDKDSRESAIEEGRLLRERLKAYTKAKIAVLEAKSALIKEHCWDPATTKPTSIESLQLNYRVDNYPMLPESEEDVQNLEMVMALRKIEMKASGVDSFYPWVAKTDSEMAMQLVSPPASITLIDEATRIKQVLVEDQSSSPEDSIEQGDRESPYVLCGSSIYHYIEPSPLHISQFELNTYLQTAHSITLLQKDVRKLQEWFNSQFEIMYQAKQKEISTINRHHQRLRHIFKELQLTCSVEHPDPDPLDPEWSQYEKPEKMLTVDDNEVGVEPYLSPSELAQRQQQAEEEERMRLLLLADNFREIALIKMMDGVLEIKWEDLLKRDIPKPKCMIEKNPEDYNKDDLHDMKHYEDQVKNLLSERQHYRKVMETDYKRVKRSLKESLLKFEERLMDFFNLKLRVEACCTQTTLHILRSRLLNPKRNIMAEKEEAAREAIMANQKALADEQLLVAQLQEATSDCRSAYEAQMAKEKSVDSKFKKEFPELSPMMAEAALRLFKKRAKIQPKAASATLWSELGRCAVAYKKPPYLTPECMEILRAIDLLDNPANAPPNMNPDTWANICKMRRQRIESEYKTKALILQIAEAENTVSIFQKSVKMLKEKDKELQANLKCIQEEQLLFEHDIEVQLALKQGLVEIPITGSLKDYENAILINRKDVAYINGIIKEAGHKKLRAMRAACNFRRGIVFQEWEHQKVRMHIEDKEDELKTIESIKVIKELQDSLKKRQKGALPGRSVLTLDREISRIRTGFEKYIKILNDVVTHYDQKIETMKLSNQKVDKVITQINVEVNELQFGRDLQHEKSKRESKQKRMDVLLHRAKLIRTVEEIHRDIVELESELDSLKIRSYPILENANRRFKKP